MAIATGTAAVLGAGVLLFVGKGETAGFVEAAAASPSACGNVVDESNVTPGITIQTCASPSSVLRDRQTVEAIAASCDLDREAARPQHFSSSFEDKGVVVTADSIHGTRLEGAQVLLANGSTVTVRHALKDKDTASYVAVICRLGDETATYFSKDAWLHNGVGLRGPVVQVSAVTPTRAAATDSPATSTTSAPDPKPTDVTSAEPAMTDCVACYTEDSDPDMRFSQKGGTITASFGGEPAFTLTEVSFTTHPRSTITLTVRAKQQVVIGRGKFWLNGDDGGQADSIETKGVFLTPGETKTFSVAISSKSGGYVFYSPHGPDSQDGGGWCTHVDGKC